MWLVFRPIGRARKSAANTPINGCPWRDLEVTLLAQASAGVLSVKHRRIGWVGMPAGNKMVRRSMGRVSSRTANATSCSNTTINSVELICTKPGAEDGSAMPRRTRSLQVTSNQ